MFESASDRCDALRAGEVLGSEVTVCDAAGCGDKGNPRALGWFGSGCLVFGRDRETVDGAVLGQGDDPVLGQGEGSEVLALECLDGHLCVWRIGGSPLQQISMFVNGSGKVAVHLDISEQLAVEERYPAGCLDNALCAIRRNDTARVAAPSIDARILP